MKNILFVLALILSTNLLVAQETKLEINSGHGYKIKSVNYSPNGKYVISGSNDNTLKLWDAALGRVLRTFKGHSDKVVKVCFSPNGKFVASASDDYTVRIWDIVTGKELQSFKGYSQPVSISFSPDGITIASANAHSVYIWNTSTGEKIQEFKLGKSVLSICYSIDGQKIVCGCYDNSIQIISATSGQVLKVMTTSNRVTEVLYSPNGKFIVSIDDDYNIKLWDSYSGSLEKTFKGHKYSVNSISISPDNKLIASCSNDNTMRIWDIATNKEILKNDALLLGQSVSFSPDGNTIVCGELNVIKFIDTKTGSMIKNISDQCEKVTTVDYSNDGNSFAFGTSNRIIVWNIPNGKVTNIFTLEFVSAASVCFSPNDKYLASGSSDDRVHLWDLTTGKLAKTLIQHKGDVRSVNFSPDGNYVLSASNDTKLIQWDVNTGEKRNTLSGHKKDILTANYSHDGNYIASGGMDETLVLWKAKSGKKEEVFETGGHISALNFSPDDKFLISGSLDNTLCLWDMTEQKPLYTIGKSYQVPDEIGRKKSLENSGHSSDVNSVNFSPDGKYFISGSTDNTIKLWETKTGNEIKTFLGNNGAVNAVKFSPNGENIISGSSDCSVKIWNRNTGEWVAFISGKDTTKWVVYTHDNYWDGSSGCGNLVSMVKGLECWNIDQFAVKNNRPDIILQRLGSTNKELISHYLKQYQKRLKRLGLKEDQLNGDYHIPTANIIETKQNNKLVDLKFKLSDESYKINKFNIYINDVPLFGSYGKEVTGNNLVLTETVELISGDNKIEVSCMNEIGAESYRALTNINYNGEAKKNIYYLAFGVSKYQNPAYNLAYADKDAIDLSQVIDSYKGKGFENVYTKILTNEQVTPEVIKASKDFVKNAKPDDTFILFIAGHGMHDSDPEATYYYLTSNADIKNLKGTAADFETIEDLLQGIPPRNKLFLMDACESGEIDEEDQGQMLAAATGVGIASRGFKKVAVSGAEVLEATETGTSRTSVPAKRTYLYQKDRYIYNDLVRRSGAIVFSSSKGGELGYERSDIENGLFTEYIMKALTTTEADKDGNRTVSTDELREYVSAQVAKASGDLQHPTVDRDNIYQKFGFGVFK